MIQSFVATNIEIFFFKNTEKPKQIKKNLLNCRFTRYKALIHSKADSIQQRYSRKTGKDKICAFF